MRRFVYALVLLVVSSAPVFGLTTARADEPCATVTTIDTVTWLANEHVQNCVPDGLSGSECRDEADSVSTLLGTIGYDIYVCMPS